MKKAYTLHPQYILLFLIIGISMLLPNSVEAQFYNGSQQSFGKNRVQYKEFFWSYYKYDNYDIYFYLGGKELALYTAKFVDEHLQEIEGKLDTGLDDNMQFIIYNNLSDLKQSNIGLISNESYNTGGVTHIIGKKIFVYFDGSHENFDMQLRAGLAQTIINQLLYGSSIGSQMKNTSLFPYPDWYMKGLVSYVSMDWSTEFDNRVRDGFLSGKYKKFSQLSGIEATYAGHAFWRFIAERYGESSISNIIYMAKISRKLESGFLYVLGQSFKNLMDECTKYYIDRYKQEESLREFPEESLLKKVKEKVVYSQLKLSPDGNYIVYTTNRSGLYKVWLKNINTGKTKRLMKGGYRLDEKVDYSYPLLAWHPSGNVLSIITERKGETFLYFYYMDTKKFEKMILYQFEKVLDYAYSTDGRSMAMSAVQRGQSDIYVYSPGSNSYDQITKDHYDDLYPRFINNSKEIVFSSNRDNDTIRFENKYKPGEVQKYYDLFLYNYSERSGILRRVTQTPLANEIKAMEYEPNHIAFLSDENGIYNQYIGRFDSTINYIDTTTHYRYYTNTFPITNYSMSLLDHDIVPGISKYGQVIYKNDKYRMQLYDQLPIESLVAAENSPTPYMSLQQAKMKKQEEDEVEAIDPKTGTKKSGKKKGFYTQKRSEAIIEIMGNVDSTSNKQQLDFNNYQFNKETKEEINREYTMLQVPLPGQEGKDEDEPPKRLNYNVEYFMSEIVTQIDFSYLNQTYQPFTGGKNPIFLNPGFNLLFKLGVTDLLEDYRITGGVRLNLNLTNNEYLFSYANLKKRLDKEIVFHRNSIDNYYSYNDIVRVYSHELYYILKWPFSPVLAVKGTLSYRNDMAVQLSTDIQYLEQPNLYRNWTGFKGELVYDNTKNLGINLYHGTRYKVFAEYNQLFDQSSQNLIVVGLDVRNYQRIHRTFIWANRFAISSSYGNNKLIYYMGGVDNWLVPKFNVNTPVDYSQNYAYQTLATNMRGFHQNIRNGNSFAVFNTELRFPVFRYFANHPIKSDFVNNFQIVAFGDVGTAWTGPHPYSDDNFLYTEIIKQPPLNITVKVQKDPIVGGFGFGARSRILGYFLRADLAWGVEDMMVLPSVFYLSLSLDF
jgi:Tol biopolymer transport system component